jgi:hypothetical protein
MEAELPVINETEEQSVVVKVSNDDGDGVRFLTIQNEYSILKRLIGRNHVV